MSLERCALVHHTGSMIRFTTAQLPRLPPADVDIQVVLPSGRVVPGHFRRHPANPNVSGVELVRYIYGRVPFGQNIRALIEVSGQVWRVYDLQPAVEFVEEKGLASRRLPQGYLQADSVKRILEIADAPAERKERIAVYDQFLRPPALRRLTLELMGHECQVEGCDAPDLFAAAWPTEPAVPRAILDVHHVEPLARVVDHHPRNLCVICGNHHRLIHGLRAWSIDHDGDDILLSRPGGALRIERDLSFLN